VIPDPDGSRVGIGRARGNDRKIRHATVAGGSLRTTGQTGSDVVMRITAGSFAGSQASRPPGVRDQ
jgi:hypothetical protein